MLLTNRTFKIKFTNITVYTVFENIIYYSAFYWDKKQVLLNQQIRKLCYVSALNKYSSLTQRENYHRRKQKQHLLYMMICRLFLNHYFSFPKH